MSKKISATNEILDDWCKEIHNNSDLVISSERLYEIQKEVENIIWNEERWTYMSSISRKNEEHGITYGNPDLILSDKKLYEIQKEVECEFLNAKLIKREKEVKLELQQKQHTLKRKNLKLQRKKLSRLHREQKLSRKYKFRHKIMALIA